MKKSLSFFFLLLSSIAFAQKDLSAKYAAFVSRDALKKHLSIIASAEMQGRETGTEGQRRAAMYIEDQFRTIGLKMPPGQNTYQQLYPLHRDSIIQTTLVVNGTEAVYGTDYYIPINGNENVRFTSSDLVFAGYGIDDSLYNDYSAINVRGKIVVFFLGEPKKEGQSITSPSTRSSAWSFPGLSKKLTAAASRGAVGALVMSTTMASFTPGIIETNKKTRATYPRESEGGKMLNYAILSHAYAKTIFPVNFDSAYATAKSNGTFTPQPTNTKTKITYTFKKNRDIINASNVLGIVEGTDKKNEYLFLTGHYDHLGMRDGKIFYGADDDGSGTCAVIAMAEAFAKAVADGHRPRRTIVFMTVSGEEKGLWGSEYYTDHPIFPLDKTTADLNTDMIGRIDTERKKDDTLNYVYVVGHDKISSELPAINEGMNGKYTNLVLDYKFDDPKDPNRIYFRSDHYNFARKGVPVLFFYDGMLLADYHQTTDTIDKINFPLYEKRAQMIFHTAWEMANREAMVTRDKPLPTATR